MATKPAPKTAKKRAAPAAPPAPAPTRAEQFADAFVNLDDALLSHLGAAGRWLKSHLRVRSLLVYVLPALVLWALWATDPDGGASTKAWTIRVLTALLVMALAHFGLKMEHDYPEADRRTLFGIAKGNPVGAGLALVAQAIVLYAFLSVIAGMAHG